MFMFLNRMKNDEGGQGLLFAALVLLVVVAFTLTVVDVGTVVHRKVQAQTAADAAAMSGAVMVARTINIVTFLNVAIVACYGAIAAFLISWAGVCVFAALTGGLATGLCVQFTEKTPRLIKKTYDFAKLINKLQHAIVKAADILISIEIYRIANKNLTNAENKPFKLSDFTERTAEEYVEDAETILKNGALAINGCTSFPPRMHDVLAPGSLKQLLNELPAPFNKIDFTKNNLSHSKKMKMKKYRYKRKKICPPKGVQNESVCKKCHRGDYATASGCTTVVIKESYYETKERTVKAKLPDKSEWPIPYQLKKNRWYDGVKICSVTYRASGKKAVSEPLFKDDDMIPLNIAFAEAVAYDYKGRRKNKLRLFNPTWKAKLRSLSLHKKLLEKAPTSLKLDDIADRVIVH